MIDDEPKKYLTESSLKKLKAEYETLKIKKIPEIADRINEAKQQGDLSENAEYHQAKEDMAWAQGRLLELEHIFHISEVIDDSARKSSEVSVGCTVVAELNGKTKEFTIVGQQEANPSKGMISNESPLGDAFIGRKKGDKVEVITPSGPQTYKILEIQLN
ncbi:MAG: transcription elongation factor GreA [Candidatus Magasanikbacteria bacterium CG10_big_fil_rev_8_21_14_0_10_36_32]|uniref:Transcription elongation factor GreA n=1 Tax=Candidatus Magasanikbacteria bacterium CG10_big_fil_rev_8_21_14_0_10_36_32 TaxID=1974646 RepID=A0A2M6W7M6_9BACT|nr:MAG: transcription elongation factor GreA [Candidatus Magasanikbacteria bacterium CG10_big_fil_rev_8_21_14_0_10_36_32]